MSEQQQTYTPRHVGREQVSERPGYGWYVPRHRKEPKLSPRR